MASGSHDVTASNRHIPHAPPPPTFSEDLIMEILQWLPVKNLLRLCCVCKSWKALILDPYFAKKQLGGSPRATRLILSFKNAWHEFILRAYPLSKVLDAVPVNATEFIFGALNRMIGTCDGIICFAVEGHPGILVLWNPCIWKYKILPRVVNERRRGSYWIYGFGYDSSAHAYKVVGGIFYRCDCGFKTEMKVLTLGTDTWKRIGDFPSALPMHRWGKFVSGTLNWLASNGPNSWVIISLDLGKETYQEVLQPDYGQVPSVNALYLRVFRDCLSITIISHTGLFFDVWLFNALCVSEDDQILLKWESIFLVYNSRNNTVKVPEIQNANSFLTSELYVESLISPCS